MSKRLSGPVVIHLKPLPSASTAKSLLIRLDFPKSQDRVECELSLRDAMALLDGLQKLQTKHSWPTQSGRVLKRSDLN